MLIRGMSVFTPLFLSRLAPVFSRYVELKRALGPAFRCPFAHAAVVGPIPTRTRRKVSGSECRRVRGMVPHP